MPSVVTVRQLNLYIKSLMEGDCRLSYLSVSGEISNFKRHFSSGHIYFTLKDENSSVKCVMFSLNASRLKFVPSDGMKVVCTGRVSVFERDGSYQLYAEDIVPAGQGELLAAFEQTKARLEKEGLFSQERKRKIPPFPEKVAVITSETGAAAHDILTVLARRFPLCKVLFCHAIVQGIGAPDSLCAALDRIAQTDADTLIIGRGGGSVEDLWCFNNEGLVRKIASMPMPVISAVGHETDFTLADFVADLRAPTPSAAAELAVPDVKELRYNLVAMKRGMNSALQNKLLTYNETLAALTEKGCFSDPVKLLFHLRKQKLDDAVKYIAENFHSTIKQKENNLCRTAETIEALSPMKTLLRGYVVAQKNDDLVLSVDQIASGDLITLTLKDGKAEALIENTFKE